MVPLANLRTELSDVELQQRPAYIVANSKRPQGRADRANNGDTKSNSSGGTANGERPQGARSSGGGGGESSTAPADEDALNEWSLRSNDDAFEALENLDNWSQRNMLNQFKIRGIEAAYQRYVSQLWVSHVQIWCILSAVVISFAPLHAILKMINPDSVFGPQVHVSLRWGLNGLSALFWLQAVLVVLLMRYRRRRTSEFLAKRQQPILVGVALVTLLGATLPVLISPGGWDESITTSELIGTDYLTGKWHVTIAAIGAAGLACSGMSPPIYVVMAVGGFALWTIRNYTLRVALENAAAQMANTTAANATATLCQGFGLSAEHLLLSSALFNYMPLFLVCFLVCYQRDSLTRHNFVILQLVRLEKHRAIDQLQGQKKRVEAAVDRAQSEAHQHIKFVAMTTPRASKFEARGAMSKAGGSVSSTGSKNPLLPSQHRQHTRLSSDDGSDPGLSNPAATRPVRASASLPSDNATRAGSSSNRHEARLLRASEQAHAARDEISQLTELAAEEADDMQPESYPKLDKGAESGAWSGRQMEWQERELAPNYKLLKPTPIRSPPPADTVAQLLRPTPIRSPPPSIEILRPTPIRSPRPNETAAGTGATSDGDPLSTEGTRSSRSRATAPAAAVGLVTGRSFCLPTAHQEEVAAQETHRSLPRPGTTDA